MTQISNKIRALRKQRNLSQKNLAELVGEHQTKISFIERGERDFSFQLAVKLARALGVTTEELVSGSDGHFQPTTETEVAQ